MFTGIIEDQGTVERIEKRQGSLRLSIRSRVLKEGVKAGDSIAVNGICLTAVGVINDLAEFDVMHETLKSSNIEDVKQKDRVNLERSLKIGGTLGGHFVYGHIDCVSAILDIKRDAGGFTIDIALDEENRRYVVGKGSVAIDGISLTIADVKSGSFSVCLIPHTLRGTTLEKKKKNDKVNVEFDMIAKFMDRQKLRSRELDEDFLKTHGFM